jgi:hypothetical protein
VALPFPAAALTPRGGRPITVVNVAVRDDGKLRPPQAEYSTTYPPTLATLARSCHEPSFVMTPKSSPWNRSPEKIESSGCPLSHAE